MVTPIVLTNSLRIFEIDNEDIIFESFYVLAYLNHCLNFIFYGLSCELFRKVLIVKIKHFFHIYE